MKKIIKFIFLVMIILLCIYSTYLRFTNLDMTETRLFITYWKQYLGILLVAVIGSILFYKTDK